MLILLSVYVTLSIFLSSLVCAAASLFCACLVSVQVSAPYVIAGSIQELYTRLFRQVARLLLKISLCLEYAAQPAMIFRCIYLSWFFSFFLFIAHVYRCVVSTTITFVFAMFILIPIRLLSSDSSCSICCSSCGVSVHRNMSSEKRRLERNSPFIFTPLFSQFNLLNMLSKVAVNSLDEMVSPCLTPLLILLFLTLVVEMYCHWDIRIYVFQDFYVHIFYSLFLQWCQYCLGLYWIKCLLVIDESNTQWYVVFTALLFRLSLNYLPTAVCTAREVHTVVGR